MRKRKVSLAVSLPACCGGFSDELPTLAVLPAVGGDNVVLPAIGGDDLDGLRDLGV